MSSTAFDKMVEWLDENMESAAGQHGISNYMGYSEYSCSAKNRSLRDFTFREYVEKRKLAAASKELGSADSRIVGMALDCGFLSGEAFSRAYSREYSRRLKSVRMHKDIDEC